MSDELQKQIVLYLTRYRLAWIKNANYFIINFQIYVPTAHYYKFYSPPFFSPPHTGTHTNSTIHYARPVEAPEV